jgi:hypothetical protein
MKQPFSRALLSFAAIAVASVATPASAVVIFLSGAPTAVPGGYEFSYQGNFSNDEGIETGSTLVIFDFAGYVDGSVFSPYADIAASAELTSMDLPLSPDFSDDPGLYNLRFTYTGAPTLDMSNIDFAGLTAMSTLGGVVLDGFSAVTVKADGNGVGTKIYSIGQVGVPTGVPEPALWAMMLGGFALMGSSIRRRHRLDYVTA